MLMYSVADQGPICGWALTHALHHRASDTDNDPHNRSAGFWHAHFGWLFSSRTFQVCSEDYHRIVQSHSKFVKFHDACCIWWGPLWSLAMPTLVAGLWGQAKAGFFVAGALRWACVQHITFFVNSVAHGEREGDSDYAFARGATGIGPRVSLLVSILALGRDGTTITISFPGTMRLQSLTRGISGTQRKLSSTYLRRSVFVTVDGGARHPCSSCVGLS